jgi:cytochrome c-type biogenesis protein CcmH/NrfG
LLAASYAATGRAEQAIASYEAYLDLDELAVDRDVVRRIIADTKAALRERAAHAQRP